MRWPPIILDVAVAIVMWTAVLRFVHHLRMRAAADPSPRGMRSYRLRTVAVISVALGVTWFLVWLITDASGPQWLHTLSLLATLALIAVGAVLSGYAGWIGGP